MLKAVQLIPISRAVSLPKQSSARAIDLNALQILNKPKIDGVIFRINGLAFYFFLQLAWTLLKYIHIVLQGEGRYPDRIP